MKFINYFLVISALFVALSSPQAYASCLSDSPIVNDDDDDEYKEVKLSPIEIKSMEQNTGQIRSFGSGESPNEQLAFNAARAQAVAALQEKVEVYVRSGLIQFMDQTQVNDQISFDSKTTNDIVSAAKGVLNGAVVIDTRKLYSSKKKMYKYEVCLAYDRAGIMNAMEAQNQRILKNREQFEKSMQFAWDELDANNGKLPIREQQANRKNEQEQQNLDRQNERDIKRMNAERANASYYLWLDNKQQGPFTYQQLVNMINNGSVTCQTKVWFKGMKEWAQICNVEGLKDLFNSANDDDVPPPMY